MKHHELDGSPYIDIALAVRYPNAAAYNLAFLRTMYKGPRRLGLYMSPSIYNAIGAEVPTVKAVHLPISGCCRFTCYMSLDKKVEGEPKHAALIALGMCEFIKMVVVDSDVDYA